MDATVTVVTAESSHKAIGIPQKTIGQSELGPQFEASQHLCRLPLPQSAHVACDAKPYPCIKKLIRGLREAVTGAIMVILREMEC